MNHEPDTLTMIAELQQIRMVGAHVWSQIRSRDEAGPVTVLFDSEIEAGVPDETASRFWVRLHFKVQLRPMGENGQDDLSEPAVEICPTFELSYGIPESEQVSEEQILAFADATATFNAWPYLREFVQSTLSRMNLPPITVPLLRRLPASAPSETQVSNG